MVDLVRAPALDFGQWIDPPPKPAPAPAVATSALSGSVPILRFGMRDPIHYGGGNYVHRLQLLLPAFGGAPALKADGVYGDQTAAAVASFYLRFVDRKTDGRTFDAAGWKRLYGM